MSIAFMPLHFLLMSALVFIHVSRSHLKFKSDSNSNGFANYKKVSKIKRFFLFPYWL
jgi:hypothetical protein